jgi:hypothetical protein
VPPLAVTEFHALDYGIPTSSESMTEVITTALAAFRARREAFKQRRRRQKAGDNLSLTAPDYGREIPPRTKSDVPDMVDQVKECCVDLTGWITAFPARDERVGRRRQARSRREHGPAGAL